MRLWWRYDHNHRRRCGYDHTQRERPLVTAARTGGYQIISRPVGRRADPPGALITNCLIANIPPAQLHGLGISDSPTQRGATALKAASTNFLFFGVVCLSRSFRSSDSFCGGACDSNACKAFSFFVLREQVQVTEVYMLCQSRRPLQA